MVLVEMPVIYMTAMYRRSSIIALTAGRRLRLEVAIPVPWHLYLDVSDTFDAEGAGIGAVAVIGVDVFPFILFSSYMVRQFFP